MRLRRRVEVTIEQREILIVRKRRRRLPCPVCTATGQMVTPQEAAALAGVSQREIFRRLEAGGVHFTETAVGDMLVCLASLTTCSTEAMNSPAQN